jgi:hypothetical protein
LRCNQREMRNRQHQKESSYLHQRVDHHLIVIGVRGILVGQLTSLRGACDCLAVAWMASCCSSSEEGASAKKRFPCAPI